MFMTFFNHHSFLRIITPSNYSSEAILFWEFPALSELKMWQLLLLRLWLLLWCRFIPGLETSACLGYSQKNK